MATPSDPQRLLEQLMAGASAEELNALLATLLNQASVGAKPPGPVRPTLLPVPEEVRGFTVRLDLHGAKPPVWRRLDLPGDLTLQQLHDVIQAAMGWWGGHLHRFRTERDHRSPYFVTEFDIDEGDDGLLEDDVRVDQLLAAKGDELWYEYDFGDGWDHRLVVEQVLDGPPAQVRCTGGRMACPPEDCGGIGGYTELATWARSGYENSLLPEVFDSAAHAHDWLPMDWHPDRFDVDEANAALTAVFADAPPMTSELAELAEQFDRRGAVGLRQVLARPDSLGPTDVSEAEAARLTETYRIFLDAVGDGVKLTSAGYLPPVVVEQFAERSGITRWWIGKANREDLTPAVADVRNAARALGLVAVRKGHLTPTAAGRRIREDPDALWRHIVARLPLGTSEFDRQAGWVALVVAGSGAPVGQWDGEVSQLLADLGWRVEGGPSSHPPADSPTLNVLLELAGAAGTRRGRLEGIDHGVAATARAAIRRP